MQKDTKLELQGFYPTKLEVTNIYQTDNEIRIKMSARCKNCHAPNAEKFRNIRMELMNERSRISQSSGNLPGFG